MINSSNSTLLRTRYEKLVQQVKPYGLSVEPSKIRVEETLKSGVGQYRFNIKKEINALRERTLDRNDVFVPNFLGVLIGLRSKTKPASMKLYSFAPINDGEKPSIHKVGFKTDDINSLYNGVLRWNVDNNVVFSAFPSENFKKVPENQGKVVVMGEANAPVVVGLQEEAEWNMRSVCEELTPRILVAGTRDHQITVDFDGANLNFDLNDADFEPVLVLYMDGFLIKNGCESINGSNAFSSVVGQW